jgi:hypothetical protein
MGEKSQWPPLAEIVNFKKRPNHLFNFFLFCQAFKNLLSAENQFCF